MAIVASEKLNQSNVETVRMSTEMAAALGETGVAEVIPFPESDHGPETADGVRPDMSQQAKSFVNWIRQSNARDGKFAFAEFKRDEGGLYVDHHGPKVYLKY
jgi:hypothetical protein